MKITDIERWRTEIQLAEEFREKEFGEYTDRKRTRSGENIDYFERGYCDGQGDYHEDSFTTLNFFHVVTKLTVPTLFFQNPTVYVQPSRKQDQDAAPYARAILNHYYRELDVDSENEMAVWDAYVVNRGITKVGYATKFGMDIPDPTEKKKPSLIDQGLEAFGLKEPEEPEEVIRPEIDQRIIAESPYIKWVSPFKFLMDPRARGIDDAMWVAEEFDKTVGELKRNKNYKNTSELKGQKPDTNTNYDTHIPEAQLEEFAVVRLYEIHYRNNNKLYRLVIVKDGEAYKELYHEESIYQMDGFQYDILEFNKHGHLQYRKSDLDKIKNLQDRFTSTIDSILEQLDRYTAKIGVKAGAVTENGMAALMSDEIGAIVECTENINDAIKEIGLTQFKADLKALIDEVINLVTIMTGITRTKLLGISTADTATGENIAQGGENIRVAEMSKTVHRFAKKQTMKLWSVITQFVDLEDIQLITGESGIDPRTGFPQFSWLPDIDDMMSEKLQSGNFRFDIEVGSTQKVDNAVLTKRIENLIGILGRTDVIALMQQQGKRVDLAEILRLWLNNNPEIVRDVSRIIQDIGPDTQNLLPNAQEILSGGRGGQTDGSDTNAVRAQIAEGAPSQELIAQESGQI